jgi:hypothetical protein
LTAYAATVVAASAGLAFVDAFADGIVASAVEGIAFAVEEIE